VLIKMGQIGRYQSTNLLNFLVYCWLIPPHLLLIIQLDKIIKDGFNKKDSFLLFVTLIVRTVFYLLIGFSVCDLIIIEDITNECVSACLNMYLQFCCTQQHIIFNLFFAPK